jgi:putative oxidoreductase
MAQTTYGTRRERSELFIPALGGVYAALEPYSLPMLRFAAGLWFVPHGMQKLFGAFGGGGLAGTAGFLESVGYGMPMFWATTIALLEFFGGLALAVGFLTRAVALAFFIFMINATIFHWGNGFFWTDAGWEYPALWAVVSLVFVIRGGGELSVDRAWGREL